GCGRVPHGSAGRAEDEPGGACGAEQGTAGDALPRRGTLVRGGAFVDDGQGLFSHGAVQPICAFLETVVWSMSEVRTVTATFQSPAMGICTLLADQWPVEMRSGVTVS